MLSVRQLRPRLTLRALLVAMTLACVWCGYSLNWIRQRHVDFKEGMYPLGSFAEDTGTPGPAFLWLFGEQGVTRIVVDTSLISESERQRLRRFFPEAEIREVDFSDPNGGF